MIPFRTSSLLGLNPALRHGFFGRKGGVSAGDFGALNVSYSAGDDPEAVRENRRLVAETMGVGPLVVLKQVHSNRVVTVEKSALPDGTIEADALVTKDAGIALGVLTADCAPILFADPEAGVIGAAHAGWKGAANDISLNTIKAMVDLGADPKKILVTVGPTISGANYEVGPDFMAEFLALQPGAESCFATPKGKREHFDLGRFLIDQLASQGLGAVDRLADCTYAEPERYFSHRFATHRQTPTGRQISVIGLA
jgi:YfiH family protein